MRRAQSKATLIATRHSPVLQTRYERLLTTGRRKKVVLEACMRKLLTMLNAIAQDGSSWDPSLHGA